MKNTKNTVKRISTGTAISLLRKNAGKIFTAVADTKNTKNRVFNCNTTSRAFDTNLMKQGVLRVYEFKNKSYRNLNVNTISSITVNRVTYKVR